jgi:signal transduction histidine kinase
VPTDEAERIEFWSQLAARMAHKLKNPLVSIKTFTQLLPERYEDDEFRRSFLDVVDAEADKINEIADRLLLYSSANEIEPVPTDLRALVETVLDALAPRIEACGVVLERHLVTLPIVMGDPERLRLALSSAVENALEAMDKGGRLVVRTRLAEGPLPRPGDDRRVLDFTEAVAGATGGPTDAFAAVEIGDTGGGIARERLRRVFQPFYSDSVRGIGLGLAIVAKVAQEHRGGVELESVPGTGTRIQLFVPAAC